MRALLLGNGVNLLSAPGSWKDLLAQLADSIDAQELMEHASVKPFALLYEEIALRSGARARGEESKLSVRWQTSLRNWRRVPITKHLRAPCQRTF